MSKRLTRSQREAIIIDFINGKETPGYNVIENSNGKFIVKAIPKPIERKIELEEEDINETNINEENNEDNDIEIPKVNRTKQNA